MPREYAKVIMQNGEAPVLDGQNSSLDSTHKDTVQKDSAQKGSVQNLLVQFSAATSGQFTLQVLADRLRVLLGARLVCTLVRTKGGEFDLTALAAESPELALSVRSRYERKGLAFAINLACRALAEGRPVSSAIGTETHALADLVPEGTLLVAPFRTSLHEGAFLVYSSRDKVISDETKSLVGSIVNLGALAITNVELQLTSTAQTQKIEELLGISCELTSLADLDVCMEKFVLGASKFLEYGRAFVGILDAEGFRIRWKCAHGKCENVNDLLPEEVIGHALRAKESIFCDDVNQITGMNREWAEKHQIRQIVALPLLGTGGEILGVFGVLDRLGNTESSPEDVRRAKAVSTHAAMALEVARNLQLSAQHRHRAELLMQLALELNSNLRLPDFAKSFVKLAADMLGATAGALAVKQESGWDTIFFQVPSSVSEQDRAFSVRFEQAIRQALGRNSDPIIFSSSADLFGVEIGDTLGWTDCTLVRLTGLSSELVGVLCIANRGKSLADAEHQLLKAITGHASIALENACFFSRMEQANRHWIEIFDAIPDFIVSHDESANVLRVNRSLADFIGVSPSELIGVNMGALLNLSNPAPLRSCPFCRTGKDDTGEYLHPVLERTYLVSTSRVHGASSEVLQTIHVLKDITDRREAERRYRELFDNIQEGLFFSTPDGRFIEVNDALVRMLGYKSREELLVADVRTEVYSSPERHLELAHQMQTQGVLRNHEETLRRKDGAAVHVLINAFAVRDAHNQIIQYRGLMLDISGLKNFQSELQRERDFSGNILNNTQSLILVTDQTGLVNYANRRWFDMGYRQSQVVGRPLEDLVAPARRDVLTDAFTAILAGNQVDNLDLQILRGDGRIGQFSVNLSPMRDEQGNVTSIVVVMSDITDAATLQAKLMHAEKMAAVGQLVSGVAHEVNNPLTAILGFADLLMENTEVPESARKDLRVILQEAQRTKQIVQNLLSFARQMPPQRKPVQLNAVLRRTVQLRAYDFHSRGVEIIEQLDQDLPYVIGDAHQLQQVFLNIMNNAYDAVREAARDARIAIMTARSGAFVEISFRDNGHGISQADRIFDPFFTTKEIGKGTGLGLSICYGIVREHGGEILCYNNADTEGATFIVRLPAVSESASIGAAAGVTQP